MKAAAASSHLTYLDGIRGFASLYVLLHHVWLASYSPSAALAACAVCLDAPGATQWLRFGQLAVVVFIVVSGYSLALAPMRHGGYLPAGFGHYIRRRAWRILPPYWVALGFSCLVVLYVTGAYSGKTVDAKAVIVHGLLLNNVVDSAKPNGTFWSIAVEWQIYFVFPLMLLVYRRAGGARMMLLAAAASTLAYLIGTFHEALAASLGLAPRALAAASKLLHLSPQFLACFAFGVAAAAVGRLGGRRAAVGSVALLASLLAVLSFVPAAGAEAGYFWIDLLAGAATALGIVALTARGAGLAGWLGSALPRWLGQSSYSLYLIHAPILEMALIVLPRGVSGSTRFMLLLALVVPLALAASRLFWFAFERPFVRSAAGTAATPAPRGRRVSA